MKGGHGLAHVGGREARLDVRELVAQLRLQRRSKRLGEQALRERERDRRAGGELARVGAAGLAEPPRPARTRLASPMRSASSAGTSRPVSRMSAARDCPTSRGRK
jgi:hypothetical protein